MGFQEDLRVGGTWSWTSIGTSNETLKGWSCLILLKLDTEVAGCRTCQVNQALGPIDLIDLGLLELVQ